MTATTAMTATTTTTATTAVRIRSRRAGRAGRRAFTLMEMLIALSMLTVVLIGALILLDTTNRVTRAQLARADIQQSVRIGQEELVRMLRMSGRGGLLSQTATLTMPTGVAIEVENNVAANRTLFAADGASPDVMEGTDILTVRGIFDSPLYYVKPLDQNGYTIDPVLQTGVLRIASTTVDGAFSQDVQYLEELRLAANANDAVVLVSSYDDSVYGVALVNWGGSSLNAGTGGFDLAFSFETSDIDAANPSNAIESASVLSSKGKFPVELMTSGFKTAGILQEYRYFIRDSTISGNVGSRFAPKLSRTRTAVNQDAYWDPDEQFEDIADFIIDLQVALGFSDETVGGGELWEADDGLADSWHFNVAGDTGQPLPAGELALIRVTTLARAGSPDRNFQARALLRLEDRSYTASDINDATERRFRRFFLPSVVDLRNL